VALAYNKAIPHSVILLLAAAVVLFAFSRMLKLFIVTKSEPIILKTASFKLPAVGDPLALMVLDDPSITTLFIAVAAPVKLIEYPPAGAVSAPLAAQVNVTGPLIVVTVFNAVIALAKEA
jgi:hypothetical protein